MEDNDTGPLGASTITCPPMLLRASPKDSMLPVWLIPSVDSVCSKTVPPEPPKEETSMVPVPRLMVPLIERNETCPPDAVIGPTAAAPLDRMLLLLSEVMSLPANMVTEPADCDSPEP